MTKPCVVPKCKTGYKTVKKCSVFKVPSNIEQLNKWQAAIPGIVELKKSQFVCEKHFEDKFIVRKKIHRDSTGRIIAEASYVYPKLNPSAVPSIFQSDEQRHVDTDVNEIRDRSKPENVPMDSIANDHNYSIVSSSLSSSLRPSPRECHDTPLADDTNIAAETVDTAERTHPPTPKNAKTDNDCSGLESVLPDIHKSRVTHDARTDESAIMNISTMDSMAFLSQHEISTPIQATSADHSRRQQSQDCPAAYPPSEARNLRFDILSKLSIVDFAGGIENGTFVDEYLVDVLRPWAASQLAVNGSESIVFSLVVEKLKNDIKIPVMQKNVTLSADKTLRYFVYGRPVDVSEWKLAQNVDDANLLPGILQRFKNTSMCNGLGIINVQHLSADSAFKDSVDGWRSNDCSLISKRKRCGSCLKLRQLLRKQEIRCEKRASFCRVRPASNPIDQKKILALQKKNLRQRRLKNMALRRVVRLEQLLKCNASARNQRQ